MTPIDLNIQHLQANKRVASDSFLKRQPTSELLDRPKVMIRGLDALAWLPIHLPLAETRERRRHRISRNSARPHNLCLREKISASIDDELDLRFGDVFRSQRCFE
ncbi:MAG: hypothetical protein R3C18_02860 [Planctomycetaceae bacterium]